MLKTAIVSPCKKYRYSLTRGFGNLMPVVMLNPSTADAHVDDATIRRLLGFAQRGLKVEGSDKVLKYDGLDVVNLYAYRATDPRELHEVEDPYGPSNQQYHRDFCQKHGSNIILAWGAFAPRKAEERFLDIARQFVPRNTLLSCFGVTKYGKPKHPLYLPNSTVLQPYTI